MKNRALFIVVGLMLVASGSMGIVLYERENRKQQEELTAKAAAEEQRRTEEERSKAEAYKAQLEAEEQRAIETERKLAAAEEARRGEEDRIRRMQDEERQAKRKRESEERRKIAQEERLSLARDAEREAREKKEAQERRKLTKEQKKRQPEAVERQRQAKTLQNGKQQAKAGQTRQPGLTSEQERHLRAAEDRERAREKQARTTVIRIELDPTRTRELKVARVHAGDRVSVKVRRMDGANQSLYVGLAPMSLFPYPSVHPGARDSRSATSALISTPIRDTDQLTIVPEPHLETWITKAIQSKDGVVLNVGIGSGPTHPARRASYSRRGLYRIEISIYSDNKWNIKPRSLL